MFNIIRVIVRRQLIYNVIENFIFPRHFVCLSYFNSSVKIRSSLITSVARYALGCFRFLRAFLNLPSFFIRFATSSAVILICLRNSFCNLSRGYEGVCFTKTGLSSTLTFKLPGGCLINATSFVVVNLSVGAIIFVT